MLNACGPRHRSSSPGQIAATGRGERTGNVVSEFSVLAGWQSTALCSAVRTVLGRKRSGP